MHFQNIHVMKITINTKFGAHKLNGSSYKCCPRVISIQEVQLFITTHKINKTYSKY